MLIARELPRDQRAMAHIAYEVEMCAMCAYRYLTDTESIAQNAYLECLLLHARTLEEFLVLKRSNPRDDDMLRTDFAPQWKPRPPDAVQRLIEQRSTINKHLTHLTWARVDNCEAPQPEGAFIQIANDIVEVTSAWLQHVADDPAMMMPVLWDAVQEAKGVIADAHRLVGTGGSAPGGRP